MEPVMRVSGLSHTYNPNTPLKHTALKNVTFELYENEILGIIGHTGSGKSTLIQHLNGLLTPSGGAVYYRGQDINSSKESLRDVRFHVGLVFQYPEYQLFEETVFRDIAFGPKNQHLSESEIEIRVLSAMHAVGLPESLCNKSPFELSGGQKRRVAIAGVMAMRPDVLILDEPTAGLDPRGREDILRHIKDYNKQTGASIIFVTHSMEDIATTVDRILVMRDGCDYMVGTPDEVFAQADLLGKAGLSVPQITRVILALRERGLDLSPSVYTVEAARDAILALSERRSGSC